MGEVDFLLDDQSIGPPGCTDSTDTTDYSGASLQGRKTHMGPDIDMRPVSGSSGGGSSSTINGVFFSRQVGPWLGCWQHRHDGHYNRKKSINTILIHQDSSLKHYYRYLDALCLSK